MLLWVEDLELSFMRQFKLLFHGIVYLQSMQENMSDFYVQCVDAGSNFATPRKLFRKFRRQVQWKKNQFFLISMLRKGNLNQISHTHVRKQNFA